MGRQRFVPSFQHAYPGQHQRPGSGTQPGRHGLVAHTLIVPFATDDHIIDTSNYQHLDALDHASNGQCLFVPTLGDILAERHERVAVAATSSPGASLLWTRKQRGRIVNLHNYAASATPATCTAHSRRTVLPSLYPRQSAQSPNIKWFSR